jgi:hypothetical protein
MRVRAAGGARESPMIPIPNIFVIKKLIELHLCIIYLTMAKQPGNRHLIELQQLALNYQDLGSIGIQIAFYLTWTNDCLHRRKAYAGQVNLNSGERGYKLNEHLAIECGCSCYQL